MSATLWGWIATPGASLLVGAICLIVLVFRGYLRDIDENGVRQRVTNALMLPVILYTIGVAVCGQFFLRIPLSTTISEGFGNDRIGWLLVVYMMDVLGRVYAMFQQPKP